jgi:DNA-binding protein YbaB
VTDDVHPQVAAVLQQAQLLQSLMDDQLDKMNQQTFIATDETETVAVTLNGHSWLTDVHIDDGLLRLGARVVEARVNEALQKAMAEAAASIEADREHIDTVVAQLARTAEDNTRAWG